MKRGIILFIILILSIGFVAFIWPKSSDNQSVKTHKTEETETVSKTPRLPIADYTQEIQPTDVLPDAEEVWIIDEEQVQ